jgi:hypothetical protein
MEKIPTLKDSPVLFFSHYIDFIFNEKKKLVKAFGMVALLFTAIISRINNFLYVR